MQTYTQIFAGGGAANVWRLEVPGRYFVILSLPTNPVDIRFFYRGQELRLGNIKNWTTGPLAGLQVGPLPADAQGIAFDKIEITPTAADTIAIGIGDGTVIYNRAAGSVSITGPLLTDSADAAANAGAVLLGAMSRNQVFNGATWDRLRAMADNADAVASLAQGLVRAGSMNFAYNGASWDRLRVVALGDRNALSVSDDGLAYATSFASTTALTANTPENIWAAASNVNGARILRAAIECANGVPSTMRASLLCKATAPSTPIDGHLMVASKMTMYSQGAGTVCRAAGELVRATNVASGLRLDSISDATDSGTPWRSVLYLLK